MRNRKQKTGNRKREMGFQRLVGIFGFLLPVSCFSFLKIDD